MITQPGFFCGCNTDYFRAWGRVFALSAKKHAPWAHMHFHVYDGEAQDQTWAKQNGCTITVEATPEEYNQDLEQRKAYWSNMRWVRINDTFASTTPVIDVDADSIMVRDLSQEQFLEDLKTSWVPTAPKRDQRSLASAVGFGNDNARQIFADMLLNIRDTSRFAWADDQKMLDIMLDRNQIRPMDLRYTDFKFRDDSYIWTGKGDRKFKVKFNEMLKSFQ